MGSTLLASLLAGGAALAQQGMIVEPWQHEAVAAPKAAARASLPSSGLFPAASERRPPAGASRRREGSAPAPLRWSPPVVELLVDPWAKARVPAPLSRPRWVPRSSEIIDPWAAPEAESPHVASRPAGPPVAAIF